MCLTLEDLRPADLASDVPPVAPPKRGIVLHTLHAEPRAARGLVLFDLAEYLAAISHTSQSNIEAANAPAGVEPQAIS